VLQDVEATFQKKKPGEQQQLESTGAGTATQADEPVSAEPAAEEPAEAEETTDTTGETETAPDPSDQPGPTENDPDHE
jgi:hypothetical protein